MKLNKLTPIIYTEEILETIRFYVDIIGFTCVEYDADWFWARIVLDQTELMISKPAGQRPFDKPTFTGSLYFNTNNVNEIWNQLKDKTRICYPIENFEYGMREFGVYDNNGYLLQFGEPIN